MQKEVTIGLRRVSALPALPTLRLLVVVPLVLLGTLLSAGCADPDYVYKENLYTTYGLGDMERFAVSGDSIYVASRDGQLMRADAKSGEISWKVATGGGLPGMPLPDGDLILLATETKGFAAFSAADGREVWHIDAKPQVLHTPAIIGQQVLLSDKSGELLSAKKSSGKVIWRFKTGAAPAAPRPKTVSSHAPGPATAPVPYRDSVVVTGPGNTVNRLKAADGSLIWSATLDASAYSPPLVLSSERTVWVTDRRGKAYIIDAESGDVRRTLPGGGKPVASALGVDSVYLFGNRRLRAVDPVSGDELWRRSIPAGILGPVSAEGLSCFVNRRGGAITVFDPRTGKERWGFGLGIATSLLPAGTIGVMTPVIGDGVIYHSTLRKGGRRALLALSADKGRWRKEFPVSGIPRQLEKVGGTLYVITDKGRVRAFEEGK